MNEQAKKILLIVVVVVALGAAVWGAKGFFGGDQLRTGVVHPSPPVSLKQLEIQKQEKDRAAAASGQTPPAQSGDRDLSGAGPLGGAGGKGTPPSARD
ncbi:MAG TPA: hypothetical protein VG944_14855 [Fimbriimonas sp.]|nr:hypothetical protein [Fimbriimonas sp.]